MPSLILKIFICYWIAAGIAIAAIDLSPHEQMHRPEVTAALNSALRIHGRAVSAAYEAGGCASAGPLLSDTVDKMDLASTDGRILCSEGPAVEVRSLIQRAGSSTVPIATNFRRFQVVALSFASPSGRPYVLLLQSRYDSPILYGLTPGTTTIVVSVVVTMLLALLIAVPIRRLRTAARDISNGRLEARVKWGNPPQTGKRGPPSDVLRGLIIDFNHMAERLQSLVAAQRVFFRDVSHELRSPLARLSVALELAREAGTESMRASLNRIEVEAARVNDLVAQLLSLSYMETVQELSQSTNLSLGDLVASVVPDIQYEADSRRCRVIARTRDDCTVKGDPVLLQRAFENVVRNAIRYAPEDGIVEIDLERVERDGALMAVLRVGDNGPGVPADELTSILRPFYRVDKSRQRSTGGFGVGLAIADRAMKLHAGEIKAWNKPSGGLVVEMIFPSR
jgi:two-component system sensor histidine kinase CpxA